MKRILMAVAMVTLLVGCNEKIEIDTLEQGTINLQLSSDVEINVFTKASTELTNEQAKDYNIVIKNSSNVEKFNGKYSAFNASQTYPAATGYTITAESCTEADAAPADSKGKVRYAGSNTFDVKSNQSTDVEVNCTMANSKAGVVFDDTFTSTFTGYSVVLTVDQRSATYEANTDENNAFYFNIPEGGATLSYVITGTFGGGNKSYSGSIVNIAAAKYVKLTIKANTSNGTIGVPTITVDDACEEQSENVEVNPYE